jgi:acyl-[acyl-carrier-protein]-phospholipid O-acyltransferase / long-chain-fatty-acid--[acyl-carrier-protein] ligase
VPAEVIVMEKLPLLGTGKVDLLSLAKLAAERAATTQRAAAIA